MAATPWDVTVGDTRTVRLRDTTAVAELSITITDQSASATLRLYDVVGPLGADPADMSNTVLRETHPAGSALLAWYKANSDDKVLWQALQAAVTASGVRKQTADAAAQAAVDAVVALIPTVDTSDLADAVRKVALDALKAGG